MATLTGFEAFLVVSCCCAILPQSRGKLRIIYERENGRHAEIAQIYAVSVSEIVRNPRARTYCNGNSPGTQGAMSKRNASRSSDQEVMRHLSRSQIFKDYERAFSKTMGVPLNIRGHDSSSPAHHGKEDHGLGINKRKDTIRPAAVDEPNAGTHRLCSPLN